MECGTVQYAQLCDQQSCAPPQAGMPSASASDMPETKRQGSDFNVFNVFRSILNEIQ